MRELRSYAGDVGEFIRLVSKVSTPAEFEALLAEIRASKAGDEFGAKTRGVW